MTTTSRGAAADAATAGAYRRSLVEQAVKSAVAPYDLVERPAFPGAATAWSVPTPMAGFRAAQQVARLAEQQVHKYALQLRGEGHSWRELADLMEIEWSEDYARPERAFELVAGPDNGSTWSRGPSVHWYCGGLRGCGHPITDRGPYNGHPVDNEDGHAEGCQRLATEGEAYERESDEQERRITVMEQAYAQLAAGRFAGDTFARDTAGRARWVQAHGGRYQGWSTSESLAVALVLNDSEALRQHGYPKRRDAIARVMGGAGGPPADPEAWLALIRAAATGDRDGTGR